MRRECIMPRHYWDIAPEPPAALSPPSSQVTSECMQMEPDLPPSRSPPKWCPTHVSLVRRILKSPHNAFGLFRQYYATCFPDHDPGGNITYNDLIDAPPDPLFTSPAYNYYPYPNQSSFLLREWYWNDGERKSRPSFQNLLRIVGHLEFHLEDVAGKNWWLIDAQLGGEVGGRAVRASTRTAGKMNRMVHWEAGSKLQSKSKSLFINELCARGKKNSMQASFIIAS